MGNRMVKRPMTSRDPENQTRDAQYAISWKQLKILFGNNR